MIQYDAKIIFEFADRLYKQAAYVVISYAVFGGLIGLIIGGVGGTVLPAIGGAVGAITGALALGVIGYSMGQQHAFALRLQAQTALCHARIEENTRGRTQAS